MAGKGDKNIKNRGKRFQPGNTVQKDTGAKPWSYRYNFSYLAAQPVDPTTKKTLSDSIKKLLKMPDGSQPTAARVVAVRMLERALREGADPHVINSLIEQTEGKLTQPVSMVPPKKVEDVDRIPEDQLEEAFKEHVREP